MNTEQTKAQVKELLPKVHGWCSPEKANHFIDIIDATKPAVCVEIGVFGGASLLPQILAIKANQHGKVYGIDPWSTESALEEMKEDVHMEWWKKVDIKTIHAGCVALIEQIGGGEYCELIQAKSEDVADRWQPNTIDLLHIDGNHSEAVSYRDAVNYLPRVKPGGIIFFDDIYWLEQKVVTTRKALNFLLASCRKLEAIGDCLVLQKNTA